LLRLFTTIKLKESTASGIFRRLNSCSRQHALYQTLKAFGQIIKSLFILRYINDLALRQAIEKQLNKVELANRFTRAVVVGNPREFTQGDKEEQEISEACNRLIKRGLTRNGTKSALKGPVCGWVQGTYYSHGILQMVKIQKP
tara:strand:- start:1489 stop:1917 length:429 start_codon:yes stop_codon:yes gene_type:complete